MKKKTKLSITMTAIIRLQLLTILFSLIFIPSLFSQTVYYIDPDFGPGGNGTSQNSPFDSWKDVPQISSPPSDPGLYIQGNNTYLQKRGTTYYINEDSERIAIWEVNNVTIGAYGVGPKPKIQDLRVCITDPETNKTIGIKDCNNFYLFDFEMNYLAAELTRYQNKINSLFEAELRGTNPKEIRRDYLLP